MQPNPYTPGGRPRVFVGREEERQGIRSRLAQVIAFGEMAGPLAIVTGPRGLGKTSLLRDVADQAATEGFVTVWLVGVKRQPLLGDLAKKVRSSLERTDVLSTPRLRQRFTELGVRFHLGIASVEAKFAPDGPEPRAAAASVTDVEELLHEASNAVRDRGGAGLLLIIDELHAPLDPRSDRDSRPDPTALRDVGALMAAVQNMEAERERYPLAVIGAGLPQTKSQLTKAATFGERTHETVLTELDEFASQALLVEPARQLDVTWTDEAISAAVRRADGYPQALQLIGSAAWDEAKPERGGAIERVHVERSEKVVDLQMTSMFLARWEVATEYERRLLRAMSESGEEVVARYDIADRMGVNSRELSVARASLISKGIIESAGHGTLRFTIPGFDRFVRSRGDE